MNLWHDIEPGKSEKMTTIIEIPRGSKNKYEIHKETGLIALDRAMHSAQDYPFDYGFVPQTLWEDDDALDVVVLTTYALAPGVMVDVRPVGFLNMTDDGENDDKVIGVPAKDPRWDKVQDIGDVNQHQLKEIEHFFATYKQLQKKEVAVGGFKGKDEAMQAFEKAKKLYNDKYGA